MMYTKFKVYEERGRNMRTKLFGNEIPPACEYCEHGNASASGNMILCVKKGVVAPFYKCRKFVYAPLKRVPKRRPKLPSFTVDDFKL